MILDVEKIKKRLAAEVKVVNSRHKGDILDIKHAKAHETVGVLEWVLDQEVKMDN